MASSLRSLDSDRSHYLKAFNLFLERSTEHQCMQQFIEEKLPDIIADVGHEKSSINVLGIGSGAGEIDLHMLSKIQARNPGVSIYNDVVEPSSEQISKYKEHVTKTSKDKKMQFTWHNMTSTEFANQINEHKEPKKYDFIHMIQMLYYVEDIDSTLTFFRNCLTPNGKLLIIIVSEYSGWNTLWKKYSQQLSASNTSLLVSSEDLEKSLDVQGATYEHHELPSDMDISECFIKDNRNGELLMDFLTETCDFFKTAPPELVAAILEDLKQAGCSRKKDGNILFNNNLAALVVEPKM